MSEIPTDNLTSGNKLYYSMGEVSQMFGVNHSLIRFWEKEFDIIKPHKNKKGNRMFTKKDIENFRLIFYLVKECGYTLEGAKKRLREQKTKTLETLEIINSLKKIKGFLLELKEEL